MENDTDEIYKPLSETKSFDSPDYQFKPNEFHEWRQNGFYLVCKSCELQHGVYIGPNKLIVGINKDGTPLLKDRKSIFVHNN